jgi:Fe2+ or Zn2+ uptake regulation protein
MTQECQELVRKFKRHGYKMTPQRRAILEELTLSSPEHPTAEQIHEAVLRRMPDTSLATVYNTLRELVAVHEVHELDLGQGVRRYEVNDREHAHLVCVNCQCVRDLPADFGQLRALLSQHNGFHPIRYDVTVYGYCDECLESRNTEVHRGDTEVHRGS